MKAIVFRDKNEVVLDEVPDPQCQPDEVVLRVATCGICGTDLHVSKGEYIEKFPIIPGHEFSGTVVEVGKNISYLKIGDRVTADPNIFCGYCDYCRNEQANHCSNWHGMGVNRDGAFAEYVSVPARNCYFVPENLTDKQAAFIEPLACVAYALRRLRVWPADKVLIFGAGPMGLLLLQAMQKSISSQVVMVEKNADRLNLAKQMGASVAVPAGADQFQALKELAPNGFNIVIDATGVPAVIESAFDYLAPRGQYLQFGVTDTKAQVKINPYKFFQNDWIMLGSFAVCYSFKPAIDFLSHGVIDIDPLVSHTVQLTEFIDMFDKFGKGETLKVHVQISGK